MSGVRIPPPRPLNSLQLNGLLGRVTRADWPPATHSSTKSVPAVCGSAPSASSGGSWPIRREPMRLFDFKHDTSLAAALITAAGIVFHQPLRTMLDVVGEFEQQYHLDLVPALVVLSVVFTFQQFQKRQATQAAARESATAARLERERGDELEHLIAFGHSLGDALDFTALEQAVWRHLPRVVANASV